MKCVLCGARAVLAKQGVLAVFELLFAAVVCTGPVVEKVVVEGFTKDFEAVRLVLCVCLVNI